MRFLFFIVYLMLTTTHTITPDKNDAENWYVINDGVMGGLSQSNFEITGKQLRYYGHVSTRNNGGFASLRYNVKPLNINEVKSFKLTITGDGSDYEFRLRAAQDSWISYVYKFQTTGEKQTINFTLKDLKPQYRGRKLNKEVYNGKQPIEIGLLIGNKKEQDFEILFHNLEIIE